MAVHNYLLVQSFEAGEDLSAKQNYISKYAVGNKLVICGAGELGLGINTENADIGQTTGAVVVLGEKIEIVAGAAFADGADLASDATGRAVTATSGDFILGKALGAASAANELVTCLWLPNGKMV